MEKLCSIRGYSRPFGFKGIILMLLVLCFSKTGAKAQGGTAMYDAINIGRLNTCSGSSFSDSKNTASGFSNTYGQASPEVWYTFTIGSSAQVNISTCESLFDTYLHVLDASGNLIASIDDNGPLCSGTRASLQPSLSAGTYYIVAEGYSSSTGDLKLDVSVGATGTVSPGATIANAIDAGTITSGVFTDTRNNADDCLGNEIGHNSNDIFYKFTLATTSVVKLSHCGSGFDTYMHLLNSAGVTIATNDDNGPLCAGTASSIKMELPAGTYYLASEGYGNSTGNIITSISVELQGSLFSNAINAGLLGPGAAYSDTRNNNPANGYGNEIGQASDDIFYKFTIDALTLTEVTISHCGTAFDTYMHVLDAAGNTIATNDDSGPACTGLQSSIRLNLGSGTYYVVSEGYGNYSGDIITQISVGQPLGWATVNQNYVRTRIPRTSITDYSTLESVNANKDLVQTGTQYFDGLGRLIQSVQRQATPSGSDLVQGVMYNSRGLEYRKYLPYKAAAADGEFKLGNPETNVKAFYNPAAPGASGIAVTAYPYADAVLEKSPLNRLLQQGAYGESWQPAVNGAPGGGHTIKTDLVATAYGQVRLWTISGNSCSTTSDYSQLMLIKKIKTDENGNRTIEYKDRLDRIVLRQFEYQGDAFTNTYYVYDNLGNLRYVIPPGFTGASFSETDPAFDQYVYAYHYDDWNRLIEKKVPGKGWEYLVYNQLDQIVLSQDAVKRQAGKWLYTRYDAVGQPIMTGEYTNGGGRDALQSAVNTHIGGAYETFTGAGTEGYSLNTFPTQDYSILTVNYYGTYNIPGKTSAYDASVGVSSNVQGLLTGTKVNILGTNNYLISVNYYNGYGRLVEGVGQNHIGGIDRIINSYNFNGDLTATVRHHSSNTANVTVKTRSTYDHMGRKKQHFEQIASNPEVKLAEFIYNEAGQLMTKTLHDDLQTTGYTYNTRGWLKSSSSNQFSMELKYDDGTIPQYNGNISNQLWGDGNLVNNFVYSYDKQNRLLSGSSTGVVMSEVMTYDLMGNISALTRNGATSNYSYNGNRLNQVTGGVQTAAYGYDENGSMTVDGRTGANLSYNVMDLPAAVSGNGINLVYTYDALGNKLRKVSNGVVREYVAGIEYDGNVIQLIKTAEGVARNNGGVYSYEYNLSDHLGNVRRTIYRNPVNGAIEVIQKDDYYPFGKRNNSIHGDNKYLYNGKELQEEIGQLDYGARLYDPEIGRWNRVDPMAELGRRLSPYNYAMNNPLLFVDPDGKWITVFDGMTEYRYDNGKFYTMDEETKKWTVEAQVVKDSYLSKISDALNKITGGDKNSFGSRYLGLFSNDEVNARIEKNNSTKSEFKDRNVTSETTVYTSFKQDVRTNTTDGVRRNDFHITLFHELSHAFANQKFDRKVLQEPWVEATSTNGLPRNISKSEIYASIVEDMLRAEQSLPLRTHYSNDEVSTPIEDTKLIEQGTTRGLYSPTTTASKYLIQILNSKKN